MTVFREPDDNDYDDILQKKCHRYWQSVLRSSKVIYNVNVTYLLTYLLHRAGYSLKSW
jgi:hypothetical protein